jgi:transposase
MEKFDKMQVVNPNAARIDVGSRSHIVAVGEEKNQVKEFNVYHSGTNAILSYLKEHHVTTVAMESTGSYWQNLFMSLQEAGFKVLLEQKILRQRLIKRRSMDSKTTQIRFTTRVFFTK